MLGPLVESRNKGTLELFRPHRFQVYFMPADEDCYELQQYIIDNYTKICNIFLQQGLLFVYPPLHLFYGLSDSDIAKRVNYYLPWLGTTAAADTFKNSILLKCSLLLGDVRPEMPSVVNKEGRCFTLYPDDPSTFEEQFVRIASAFKTPVGTYVEELDVCQSEIPIDLKLFLDEEAHIEEIEYALARDNDTPKFATTADSDIRYAITGESRADCSISKPMQEVMEKVSCCIREEDELELLFRLLRTKMPDYAIRELFANALKTNEVVSRLVVTKQFKIILPDYNNMEIRMTPKEKALYLLFLRHPEGIPLKLLPDYKRELGMLYRKVAKRDLKQVIEDTIDNMVDVLKGDADVQRSRIKNTINKAFEKQFCQDYSKYYTINGIKGECMKIDLPQDKIVWEVDL